MNAISTPVSLQRLKVMGGMRSPRGFWGAIVLLAMLPLALLYQMIFANGFSTFIHWVLAAGSLLISWAVFDFGKLPKWINWIGCLFVGTLAAIFFLQGLSDLMQNDSLTYLAYQVLGQQLEGWLPRLFILFWCGALLLLDSQGKMRIFGFIEISIFICAEVYRLSLSYLGASPNEILKALLLLPIVWLLLESKKSQPKP